MCGIAGQFIFDETLGVDPQRLESMANRIRHRGPEAEGIWTEKNVGFSHVRLKFSDSLHGLQPMMSSRGTVLVYNGEIYNNVELRAELAIHDYPFRTMSDTEVLLAAYEVWGEAAWKRLNGMFAFALHDPQKQMVYLVRDRFGIKPLYYRLIEKGVEFGSEPAEFFDNEIGEEDLSPDALFHYLRFAQPAHDSRAIFRELVMVEPGMQVCITKSGIKSHKWWNPVTAGGPLENVPENHTSARLRHLMHLAVGRQIAADSEVGTFLSGGIDSAILVGLQSQMSPQKVHTFTVAVEGDLEDLEASRIIASRWQTCHHELLLTPAEFFASARELTRIRSVPVSLPNEVLIYALSRHASQSVKAVLCGEGADEFFGGYSRLLQRMSKYFSAERAMQSNNKLPMMALKAEMKAIDLRSAPRFFASCYSWFPDKELKEALQPDWAKLYEQWRELVPFESYWSVNESVAGEEQVSSILQQMHLPHLLSRLDGATMAASIEGRVPFTDNDLAAFAASLPYNFKIREGMQSKWLLRNTFSDLLPAEIIGRPKKAFHASLDTIFNTEIGRKEIQSLVDNSKLMLIFKSNSIQNIVADAVSTNNYLKAWLLFSLSMWMNRNIN